MTKRGNTVPTKVELELHRDLNKTFRSLDLQTVAEEVFSSLNKNFLVDFGTLFLTGERGQNIERVFRMGIPSDRHQAERFGMTKIDIEKLVKDMIPRFYNYAEERDKRAPVIEGKSIGILACFPLQLVYNYDALIFLGVAQENVEKTLLKRQGFDFLCNFMIDISYALKNAIIAKRLNELITKDDLTMTYNRRFFEDYFAEELDRARRYNSPLSLIFLDLDGLREVNNRFGHAMGSRTLQEAAARILNAVRSIDKVVRYGGDEFCIVLPETETKGATEVAERVRQKISSTPFLLEETGGIEITASFGISCYPIHAVTKEDMIKRADEAMFEVKSQSKNNIKIAQPLKRFP